MHASHDARRVSHTRPTRAFTGARTITRCALGAPPTLRFRGERRSSGKPRAQKRAAGTRRSALFEKWIRLRTRPRLVSRTRCSA